MNAIADELPLAVVGCDFRVASSRWRSRLVLQEPEAVEIAAALRNNEAGDGFVDLNTCNRNEWIVSSQDARWTAELLKAQMVARVQANGGEAIDPYVYVGEEAARHIFRVAIGQESLVVGERQIASQLYSALEVARGRRTSSRILNGLGSIAGRLVRIGLRRNCIGNAAVGVHSLALGYLFERLPAGRRAEVAIVGLGRIGKRLQGPLEENPQVKPVLVNRTVPADRRGDVRPLTDLAEVLAEVDAAVVCTGAMQPVVRFDGLPSRGPDRPLLLVDIGIPEQVERGCAPDGVQVAGLDELTGFYRTSCPEPTLSDPDEIERLIQKALTEFRVFCNERTFAQILDTVQRHHSQLVREEIPRLVGGRFGYLAEEVQAQLEQDLRGIVLDYTSEVFRTIKETALKTGEGEDPCREEP